MGKIAKAKNMGSFRIYEKDSVQYIQSQANGKWVQIVANNADRPLKAANKKVSTWERFQIETINEMGNYETGNAAASENAGWLLNNIMDIGE